MKFIMILMLAFMLQLNANTHAQKITLNLKNASLEKAFKAIRAQSNYNFYYEDGLMLLSKPITLMAVDKPLAEILEMCMAGQPFSYSVNNKTVVLREKEIPIRDFSRAEITVKGKVLDETNQPVPGASVKVRGAASSTVTDNNGEFSIKVSEDAILLISFVGYKAQEVPIEKRKNVTVILVPFDNSLNEVVVTAFGQKQRKIETLGAQSTMNVEDLKQPVANISTVLAGRVSGLVGVQRSGEPGRDGASLWIRGVITQGNNTPLILVDGVERAFSNIDPNDIESFSILKDASSTSVYGVRGANGVILINTKRGKAGRTDINLDYYQGLTNFTRVPETADGVTYMQMANEASTTRGGNPIYSAELINKTFTQEDPFLYPNVNWFDEIFNDFGKNRKANLSIRGGGEKSTFFVSAGYYDETGLFKTDGLQQYNSAIKYSRVNFSSAMTLKASKSTTVDLGIKGWISNGNYPGTGTSDIFANSLRTYPILYPKMYPDNKEPFLSTGGGLNSSYALLTNRGYSTTYENQIMSDIRITQDLGSLVNGLSAHVLYSFDATNTNTLSRIKKPTTYYATSRNAAGELVYSSINPGQDYLSFGRSNGGSRQFYLEGAFHYARTFGKHKLGGLALYYQNDRVSATAGDLIGSIPFRSLGSVGRFTYSYDDRYLAEATFGYNGAENFAPNKRYGFFPSYALGWVISNEKFYGNANKIFQLIKLRGSYGIVGSSNIGGRRFSYIGTVGNSGGGYQFGQVRNGNAIQGIDIADYPVDATWETERDLNLGLELKTLNNALSLQFDVFTRKRENVFLTRGVVPDYLGIKNNLLGNLGITEAKGIDFTGNFDKNFGALSMSFQGTFTYNKNKMIEDDSPAPAYPWLQTRGQSVFARKGYIADGFFTQAEIDNPAIARTTGVVMAGDLKFRDLNGDGTINADDQTFIGKDQVPQIVYGFGTTLGYKGFSLGAFFQGVGAVDFYFSNEFMPFRNGSAKGSLYSNILDRWTPQNPNPNAFYPRLSYGADINQNYSVTNSHFVMNGRFLRLKTLDFGYTFKKEQVQFMGMQRLRLYFIGYNLFTISPFKFWDPELGGGSGTSYPNIKTFSLGLSATF